MLGVGVSLCGSPGANVFIAAAERGVCRAVCRAVGRIMLMVRGWFLVVRCSPGFLDAVADRLRAHKKQHVRCAKRCLWCGERSNSRSLTVS